MDVIVQSIGPKSDDGHVEEFAIEGQGKRNRFGLGRRLARRQAPGGVAK
jgi:hypothetical protein